MCKAAQTGPLEARSAIPNDRVPHQKAKRRSHHRRRIGAESSDKLDSFSPQLIVHRQRTKVLHTYVIHWIREGPNQRNVEPARYPIEAFSRVRGFTESVDEQPHDRCGPPDDRSGYPNARRQTPIPGTNPQCARSRDERQVPVDAGRIV